MKRLSKGKLFAIVLCALLIAQAAFGLFPTAIAAETAVKVLSNNVFITADANNKFDILVDDADGATIADKVLFSPQLISCVYDKNAKRLVGYIDSTLERGSYPVKITYGDDVSNFFTITIGKTTSNVIEPTPSPYATPAPSTTSAIVLNATDSKGNAISTPSGNFGEPITLVVPMRNRGGYITDFDLRMDIADAASFPFDLGNTSYVRKMPDFYNGAVFDATFKLKLSTTVTKGVKPINFIATYKENGVEAESKFTVYVNVVKGAPEITPYTSGPPVSAAKLIISKYKTTPDRLFAGEEFDLEMTFKNTSDKDDISNIKITLKNEDGNIIPAASGSNTLYIKRIGKGEEVTETVKLQSRPDSPAKPQTVSVALEYEGATPAPLTSTESITLSIGQKMRVVIEDPRVMADGVTIGTPFNVSFNVMNMGKAPLYNLVVKVDSDVLAMEEGFFGGTVAAGSSARADFNLVPSASGQIDAKILITYEDEYGEQTAEEKPISVMIMDSMPMPNEGGEMPVDMPVKKSPIGKYALIGGGVVLLIVALVVFTKIRRKKKAREFEDVNI